MKKRLKVIVVSCLLVLSIALLLTGFRITHINSEKITAFWISLWILWPCTLFAVITYPLPDRVFKAWSYFSVPWILLSVAVISSADATTSGGWGIPHFTQAFNDYVIMNGLYVLMSALIVTVSMLVKHKKT